MKEQAPHDTAFSYLKKDVRFLTTLLGDVIREQEGDALFLKIEEIRNLSRKIRENARPEPKAELKKIIHSLGVEEAYKVARAFTIYFQLVNIAEERQRVRRIRHYERDAALLQEMSLRKLFHDLHERGVSGNEVLKLMSQTEIELVLTAHPTEAKRRTVLDHLLHIEAILAQFEREDVTVSERGRLTKEIKETLEILWQTSEIRQRKVGVLDEVDQMLFYFQRTIFDLLPHLHEKVLSEYRRFYGQEGLEIPPFIHFGSWVGSDRDGNPNVTCEVTWQTVFRQRRLIFRLYRGAIERLMLAYSQSVSLAKVSEKLLNSLRRDRRQMPRLSKQLEKFESSEIYRKKFSFIYQKLENTLFGKKPAYLSEEGFIKDLLLIKESLEENKGHLASSGDLDRLIWQVQTFGFYLARLDFRDHSQKIRRALAEIFPEGVLEEEFILSKIVSDSGKKIGAGLSGESRDILDQFKTIREIQEKQNNRIVGDYILSMTETPADVLSLFYLAKTQGLIQVEGGKVKKATLAIVPLFETIEALGNAHRVLEHLFSLPLYRSYVRARGDFQQVMLGYSDSNKDGGYFAANWKLYLAQKGLAKMAERHGIKLQIFHGKGGTIDRGGGESHKAILAQPFAAVGGQIKVTEQGEVVTQKYSNAVIAERNLEQLISAVLWTNLVSKNEVQNDKRIPVWEERMSLLSDHSFGFYQDLIFGTQGFLEFYHQATPIQVLEFARIGSRPAARRGGEERSFQDLRAIPWVFSWIQSRYIISAWYGIGYAFQKYIEAKGERGLEELHEMYNEWPFFRSLINNAQISLAKTDLFIAEEYGALVKDKALRDSIHNRIAKEYDRAVEGVLEISHQKELLDFHPVLKESIRLRNPYVDPLNYIQLRFLDEIRYANFAPDSDSQKRRVNDILLLTMNGIAFGMKSTG